MLYRDGVWNKREQIIRDGLDDLGDIDIQGDGLGDSNPQDAKP